MGADLEAKREQKVSNHQIFVNRHAGPVVFGVDTMVGSFFTTMRAEANVRKGSTAVDFTVECEWLERVETGHSHRISARAKVLQANSCGRSSSATGG